MNSIREAIKRPPSMMLHIKNYHWENKKTNKGTRKVKVYTGEAREPLPFSDWADYSPSPDALNYVDVLHITRLYTHKLIKMSAKVEARYEIQKEKFINEHKDKDQEYEYMFHQRIENHNAHTTIVNPARGGYPWYTNT
jgi:hypothetical protein